MQDAVLVRVMHGAGQLHNQVHCPADRYWLALDHFIQLAAFNEVHAEIALAIAFADLKDGNDSWVLEAGGSFGLAAETLQMRFGGPKTQSKQFERNSPVQTFLMLAVNNALAAPTNFLQQFIITEVSEHSCRSRRVISIH